MTGTTNTDCKVHADWPLASVQNMKISSVECRNMHLLSFFRRFMLLRSKRCLRAACSWLVLSGTTVLQRLGDLLNRA